MSTDHCTPSGFRGKLNQKAIRSQQRVSYLELSIQAIKDWHVLRVSKYGKGTIEPCFHCNCEGFRATDFNSSVQFELCLNGQKKHPTNKKRALNPIGSKARFKKWRRGELKQAFSTNENKGFLKIASRRGTLGARANQLPNNKAAQDDLLSNAQRSIQASLSAIEKLINATPLDDHYTLERLGPVLCELRAAESILRDLEPPYNA